MRRSRWILVLVLAVMGTSLCAAAAYMPAASSAPETQPSVLGDVVGVASIRRTATGSRNPSRIPSPIAQRPTRLAIPALRIDLPVIVPARNETYPLCDVAEIETRYATMTDGVTYLYAHAREGMLWELLAASRRNDGRSLIGLEVLVWTDALVLHRYRVLAVHRGQSTFTLPDQSDDGTDERLWLQTSESATRDGTKLMVAAAPTSTEPATPADSLPKPRPRVCGR